MKTNSLIRPESGARRAVLALAALGALVLPPSGCGGPGSDTTHDTPDANPCATPADCARAECTYASFCLSCHSRCDACQRCEDGVCVPNEDGLTCQSGCSSGWPSLCAPGICLDGSCCSGCIVDGMCVGGDLPTACGNDGARCEQCEERFPLCDNRAVPYAGSPWGCEMAPRIGVTAGGDHTCVVDARGTAYCSGPNAHGELGVHSTLPEPTPTPVAYGIAHVSIGERHSCLMSVRGEVSCSGSHDHGQLGMAWGSRLRVAFEVIPEWRATDLDCGGDHCCLVTPEGALGCWGRNDVGQLGLGDRDDRRAPSLLALEGFHAVSAGREHTCGLNEDGALYCWGSGATGALGDGGTTDRDLPVLVGEGFAAVSAGVSSTCAVTADGSLMCWGANESGQLGVGDTEARLAPTRVGSDTDWRAVSVGDGHACGLRESGGIHCFGSNASGELGLGDREPRLAPTRVLGLANMSRVSVGADHSCASDADGEAFCWGRNKAGALGAETPADRDIPGAYAP